MSDGTLQVPDYVVVTIDGETHRIHYTAGDTLLETLVRGGVAAPFFCLEGNCGTCMVRRVRGAVALRSNNVLTDDDLAQGLTLACQGVPTEAVCEIEFVN